MNMGFEIDKQSSLNIKYFFSLLPLMIFTFNILVTINSAVYVKGVVLTTRKKIMMYYLKTDFIMDIITLIPLHLAY